MAALEARDSAIGGNREPLSRQKVMPVGVPAGFLGFVWPTTKVRNRSITRVLI
jgi:hypothetical protein